MKAIYKCPTCSATKEIINEHGSSKDVFPLTVPCGWRGCEDRARMQ